MNDSASFMWIYIQAEQWISAFQHSYLTIIPPWKNYYYDDDEQSVVIPTIHSFSKPARVAERCEWNVYLDLIPSHDACSRTVKSWIRSIFLNIWMQGEIQSFLLCTRRCGRCEEKMFKVMFICPVQGSKIFLKNRNNTSTSNILICTKVIINASRPSAIPLQLLPSSWPNCYIADCLALLLQNSKTQHCA